MLRFCFIPLLKRFRNGMPNPHIGKHGKKTQFKRNNKGGGRPRKLPEITELIDKVMGEEIDGMTKAEALLRAIIDEGIYGKGNTKVRAGEVALNRAYGAAKQTIENLDREVIINVIEVPLPKSEDRPSDS